MAGLYEYDDDNKVVDEEEEREQQEQQEQEAEGSISLTPVRQFAVSMTSRRRDDGTYTTAPQPRNEAAEAILNNNNKTQGYYSFLDEWKNTSPIESDADYEKRRKRARNAALFSAIGDGISSLANLYATTRYAPSAYNANTPTMTGKVLERYDKMEEQRQKDKATWAAGMQKARQLDYANAKDTRNYLLKLAQQQRQEEREAAKEERAKAKDERAKAKDEREAEMHEPKLRAANAKAEAAEDTARNTPKWNEQKTRKNEADIALKNAQRNKANSSSKGKGKGSGKYYGTFLGTEYKTQADYDAAVRYAHDKLYADDKSIGKSTWNKQTRSAKGVVLSEQDVPKDVKKLRSEVENYLDKHPEKIKVLHNNDGSMFK